METTINVIFMNLYISCIWYYSVAEISNGKFTNKWVVEIRGGEEAALNIAKSLGFTFKGQAGEFEHHYVMTRDDYPAVSSSSGHHVTRSLQDLPEVAWAEQMVLTKRKLPDFVPQGQNIEDILTKRKVDDNCDYDPESKQSPCFSKLWSMLFVGQVKTERKSIGFSTNPADAYQLKKYRGVTLSEGLYISKRSSYASMFNDPDWNFQWYVQDYRTTARPVMDHNVVPVYNMGYKGEGVVVAIVDGGVQDNHPDLEANFDKSLEYNPCQETRDCSFTEHKSTKARNHGTKCAGVIGMVANNKVCGVGIAYKATITGINSLCIGGTDLEESKALSHEKHKIDIYSCSWGPEGEMEDLKPVGHLLDLALHKGIIEGRRGKGSIYVFAAGNNKEKDNCATNGLVNHVATISIAAANQKGKITFYSERCAAIFATAYSSDYYTEYVATVRTGSECIKDFGWTSAATPIAAGILALVLGSNPQLTHRDVLHLITMTSEVAPLADNEKTWYKNKKGFWVSNDFGFGLLNAENLVRLALTWKTVPDVLKCVTHFKPVKPIVFNLGTPEAVATINVPTTTCGVNYLEQVIVTTNIDCNCRGGLFITMKSPSGTKSTLMETRDIDDSESGFKNWDLKSVHNWGENPIGNWIIEVAPKILYSCSRTAGTINQITLTFYGTAKAPHKMTRKYSAFRLPDGRSSVD